MNVKCFILLEIAVRLCHVVSYTVVLKQVKPLHQPVKVYRYDLRPPKIIPDVNFLYPYKPVLGQKIYPVKGKNFRSRGVAKKDGKYLKSLSTEKPPLRLYGISQQLVPPLSNQIEEYSESKTTAEEETPKEEVDARPLPAAPSHEKSFASFGQEKGRVHKNPGEWATPPPKEDSENTTQSAFTPSQLYLQIRHKNTVIHVPQSEALKDAETLEELINAPRLKELARTTHVQETYSEEGYEDAAYDHAGQIRQAQHGEVYDAKDEGRFKIQEAPIILDYDSDLEESKRAPLKSTEIKDQPQAEISNKLEPRMTRSRSELRKAGVEYKKEPPPSYKGDHIFSSRLKISRPKSNTSDSDSVGPATFPSFFGEMPPPPDNIFTNDSLLAYMTPPLKISSKYRKEDLNSTKIYPVGPPTKGPSEEFSSFKPHVSAVDSQPSPSAKSLKYSRIYSKKTKHLRLEPYKTGNVYTPPPPPEHLRPPVKETPEEPISERIVLPTIGYINSLTTAHFGKDVPAVAQEEPKTELTSALNLTQALNYLRSNKDQKSVEVPKVLNETDVRSFEPMKLKKQRAPYRNFANKTKRDVYLIREEESRGEEGEYEGDDEEDLPHKEKNSEISEDERRRIEEENREKEKFEEELRDEITAKEKEIIKEAFKNIGNDFPEDFPEDSSYESDLHYVQSTAPTPVDLKKYPFYRSKRLPENSPLRYASDPVTFPRKSGFGMEFYESRERLIQCPDFHPDLGDLPNSNSTEYSESQAGENQRLTSLGDKIACLRSKYFDPEPFDNPIFKEREIDYVGKPRKGFKKVIIPPRKTGEPLKGFRKHSTPKPNAKKTVQVQSNASERPHENQASESVTTQKRVSQRFIPIKMLPFHPTPTTAPSLVKPRTPVSPTFATKFPTKGKPPTGWKTRFSIKPTASEPARIVLRKNCIHDISKIATLDGKTNVTIECSDATLIQEIVNGVGYVRIIPKERWSAKISSKTPPDEWDWVPIVGYALPNFTKPLNRKTDEIAKAKNETTEEPSSDQYVIDELKEDKNIRQGEVVEDIDHYLKMADGVEVTTEGVKKNETRRRRREAIDVKPKKGSHVAQRPAGSVVFDAIEKITQAQVQVPNKTDETTKPALSKLFEAKRTLGRLSGRDFLTRYHKNKSKPKTADFWKVATTNKNPQKNQKLEKTTPVLISRENSTSKDMSGRNGSSEKSASAENRNSKSRSGEVSSIAPTSTEKVTRKAEDQSTEKAAQMEKSPQNLTKIVTKVSKEVRESSEKPRGEHKKYESLTGKGDVPKSWKKAEVQYKTINRNKNYPKKTEPESASTDGPILYYVVDVRSGRGKWITNYEEQRRSGKSRKPGKGKENPGGRREKRRKKAKF